MLLFIIAKDLGMGTAVGKEKSNRGLLLRYG